MKLLRSLSLLVFLLPLSVACRSSAPAEEVPCTCGQPEADMVGCAHALCLDGKSNPDNPDCVCGGLTIPR